MGLLRWGQSKRLLLALHDGRADRPTHPAAEPEPDALVFGDPVTGEPLGHRKLYERLREAPKAAGLSESFGLHSLRHSYGTALAAQGVPMRTLQECRARGRRGGVRLATNCYPIATSGRGISSCRARCRSSGGGTRTHNRSINSRELCQLSYPGTRAQLYSLRLA